ncbi:unnamed protein product [Clonostachys rosea f. rosea IK726]|uniref:UDP-glycosyltransferases domain-containing protein n=2 Tax=Bionectria ochroleuca TaxID=29856 RepID=A0A0B7KLZ1_BIOOC|nr:unnamed protein product [Clonostachys rosea f. rosea IK726]
MFLRLLLVAGAVIAALVALFIPGSPEREPYVQGRNKTALFISNIEHGLSNVHVATASALLEGYPDIEVHFASFAKLRDKLARVSAFAQTKTPAAKDIIFHEIRGQAFFEAVQLLGHDLESTISPPGIAGIDRFTKSMQDWISPWSAEEHMVIYDEIGAIIDEIDPAVVVLDTLLRPALDSTRDKNRLHAIVSPNTLVDNFLGDQPYGSMFWKYPALSSGFDFPVPWRNMLENIYLNFRFIYAVMLTPNLSAKKAELRTRGLKDPINFLKMHRPDVPWITMNTEGASIPVDVVPTNVTCAGPILLSVAPASEQDPELAEWVGRGPTVLINLGSGFAYSINHVRPMVGAIVDVLTQTDVQVLWKFNKYGEYSDDELAPLKQFLDSGRLRLSNWLPIDVLSLLETGDIVASVHHGGSNCFHEAVNAGVPHVILPLWVDLYNFAALSETAGIGVWGCRDTSPNWTADGISNAIIKVVDGGDASISLREKAKSLGDKLRAGEKGRDISAREIAKLAYVK